jgi:hypothetical protein
MSELFSNILDAAQDAVRHMTNADFPVLMGMAVAVVVVGILIMRR